MRPTTKAPEICSMLSPLLQRFWSLVLKARLAFVYLSTCRLNIIMISVSITDNICPCVLHASMLLHL